MPEKSKRKTTFNYLNKFQKRILYPILVPSFSLCLFSMLCLSFYYEMNLNQSHLQQIDPYLVNFFVPGFLLVCLMMMLFVTLWILLISNKIFGAYDRLIKELDDMLQGKGKKIITVRKGDEMFNELLKRFNALLKKD
ncbi:MAG: hypothetical protein ABIJ41_04225 [Candidatus Omnitrophota bacterium]